MVPVSVLWGAWMDACMHDTTGKFTQPVQFDKQMAHSASARDRERGWLVVIVVCSKVSKKVCKVPQLGRQEIDW